MKKYKNELHKQYGDFIVISVVKERAQPSGLVRWVCRCTHCGAEYITRGARLRNGEYRSCKCRRKGGRKMRDGAII